MGLLAASLNNDNVPTHVVFLDMKGLSATLQNDRNTLSYPRSRSVGTLPGSPSSTQHSVSSRYENWCHGFGGKGFLTDPVLASLIIQDKSDGSLMKEYLYLYGNYMFMFIHFIKQCI